eukprot:5172502-Pleurochrysis_carterae.AAC.1
MALRGSHRVSATSRLERVKPRPRERAGDGSTKDTERLQLIARLRGQSDGESRFDGVVVNDDGRTLEHVLSRRIDRQLAALAAAPPAALGPHVRPRRASRLCESTRQVVAQRYLSARARHARHDHSKGTAA